MIIVETVDSEIHVTNPQRDPGDRRVVFSAAEALNVAKAITDQVPGLYRHDSSLPLPLVLIVVGVVLSAVILVAGAAIL